MNTLEQIFSFFQPTFTNWGEQPFHVKLLDIVKIGILFSLSFVLYAAICQLT